MYVGLDAGRNYFRYKPIQYLLTLSIYDILVLPPNDTNSPLLKEVCQYYLITIPKLT